MEVTGSCFSFEWMQIWKKQVLQLKVVIETRDVEFLDDVSIVNWGLRCSRYGKGFSFKGPGLFQERKKVGRDRPLSIKCQLLSGMATCPFI